LENLDFLGFSRQKQAFSMGYAGFSGKNIFPRPSALHETRADGT
jgi:hypothetical protein